MTRAVVLVMDSFGISGAPDAERYGDAGADTLGHIAQACRDGRADKSGLRSGPLLLPHLARLGLGLAATGASGAIPLGLEPPSCVAAAYGSAAETSAGKDTPSGHWEIAGLPVPYDWGLFPRTEPCFPPDLTAALVARCGLPGILGDRHASGTDIIRDLGEEHIRTGKPICYTSADSVFQIAAHETHFGLARLYEVCRVAKTLLEPLNIGRVIARPFTGDSAATFARTANRRDLTTPPHSDTLLDRLIKAGGTVIAVGKIADIFAHRGITQAIAAKDNHAVFDATLAALETAPDHSLVFANFVDFDAIYGHRRDVAGYAAALEAFDTRLPALEAALRPGDLALITADHGCDPTWHGTDHTREQVPMLWLGPGVHPVDLGTRATFADMGQTVACHLGLAPLDHGTPCF
jgi:phosphopentomutase